MRPAGDQPNGYEPRGRTLCCGPCNRRDEAADACERRSLCFDPEEPRGAPLCNDHRRQEDAGMGDLSAGFRCYEKISNTAVLPGRTAVAADAIVVVPLEL